MRYLRLIVWYLPRYDAVGVRMENTYILTEYYKVHNPEKMEGGLIFSL